MECDEVGHRLADHLNGGLAGPVAAELHDHAARCDACRAEVEAVEAIWEGLADIPADRLDASAMRARFDHMLDAYAQGLAAASGSGGWTGVNAWLARWWPEWWRQPLAQAGLAAAALTIGVAAGTSLRAPAPAPPVAEIAELRRELHDMREMLTLSLMQQQSAAERLRGVSGSSQIEEPGSAIVGALLDTLLHDPNVNVRLASVDALRRFSSEDAVRKGTVAALGASSFPLVQIALIDFMVETKDARAADALRRLAADATANEAVRDRAARGLEQLNL